MFKSFFKNKYFATRTFTYYIPAPPSRKTGYQEREFDAIVNYIASLGFELIDFKLESHNEHDKSGMWIVCILGAPTKEIFLQKIDPTHPDLFKNNPNSESHIQLDESIAHDI